MTKEQALSFARKRLLLSMCAAGLITAGSVGAVDTTYTTDAEFDQGTLQSVDHDAPNNDQLQVASTIQTLPVLYTANAGDDTVSLINTDTDCEEARYRTWFDSAPHGAFSGPAPSRTAVDQDGNVYVANRTFVSNRPASVLKILAEDNLAFDRNANGVIDTSTDTSGDCTIQDPAEIVPLVDTNANGLLDTAELADERVAWITHVGPNNGLGRSLCLDPRDGAIWVGLFNSRRYYKLDPTTGAILDANGSDPDVFIPVNWTPYGCVVDNRGVLYSASLSSTLGIIDDRGATPVVSSRGGPFNYGISLGNGFVYLGNSSPYAKYTVTDPPQNGVFSTPAGGVFTRGVSVDGDGNVVQGQTTISKRRGVADAGGAADSVIWSSANPGVGGDQRGVLPDANQNVWVVNLNADSLSKFDGTTGNRLLVKPVGREPYTYSDATGSTLALTNPVGRWTIITDGSVPGAVWDEVRWNDEPEGSEPAGTSITAAARAADSLAGLSGLPFDPVGNGADPGKSGQFIEVRFELRPNTTTGVSPVLSDATVSAAPLICDPTDDGQVDIFDIRAIAALRNTASSGPGDPNDPNGDGVVNILDVRYCQLSCTNARCAP